MKRFNTISFGLEAADAFLEASRVFRERSPEEGYELVGRVVGLGRLPTDTSGDVTILEDKTRRRVRVHLDEPAYGLAVDAHGGRQRGKRVRCRGILRHEIHRTTLDDPVGFEVLPDLLG